MEHLATRGDFIKVKETPLDWIDPTEVYTTVMVREQYGIAVNPGTAENEYFWYDFADVEVKCALFSKRSRPLMDAATGRLAGLLGPELIDTMLHESRVFIDGEGKPSQPVAEGRVARGNLTPGSHRIRT